MSEPTGERFIPEQMGGGLLEAEHQVRYRFALPVVAGKRVLDAGCGVGWGSKLVADAGAASVTGVDIDPAAIADASNRVPEATFVTGDLLALPFDDGDFDVVLCFEAIEHTGDTQRTIDELARVTASGGIMFVSSPNPEVYPAGNPFHKNEETPTALLARAEGRFKYAQLFHQYSQIASVLTDGRTTERGELLKLDGQTIAEWRPGDEPYSLVVASNALVPSFPTFGVFAPADQLLELDQMTRELRTEGDELRTQGDELRTQGDELRTHRDELLNEYERLSRELALMSEDRDRWRDEHRRERELAAVKLDLVVERCDAYAAAVLAAEQNAARAEQDAARIESLLGSILASESWRLTAPLRRAMAALRGLGS